MQDTLPVLSASVASVLQDALAHAGSQLSLLVEREIAFHGSRPEYARLEDLPLHIEGSFERPVTAIYLAFSGGLDGHVVLSFTPDAAAYLARTILMSDDDLDSPTMRYLADSMLGELGNVAVAAFLNAVADAVGISVYPTPPCVVHDMLGAVLDSVITEVAMEQSYGLLLRTLFVIDGDPFGGDLILLPSQASCARLEAMLAADHSR